MAINLLMPALSPTMTEGTISKWCVKVGDTVQMGQVLAEIETDKATMEVEAIDEGTIAALLIEAKTNNVTVNRVIAILREDNDSDDDIKTAIEAAQSASQSSESNNKKGKTPKTPEPDKKPQTKDRSTPQTNSTASQANSTTNTDAATAITNQPKTSGKTEPKPPKKDTETPSDTDRLSASPLARRLAHDWSIDLTRVQGTGPGGRIVKADIESYKATGRASVNGGLASLTSTYSPNTPEPNMPAHCLEPHSPMRQTIARRLSASKRDIPHFYVTATCRLDNLLTLRKQLNEALGVKISVNDCIVKAAAHALMAVPAANVAWQDEGLACYETADISIAVALDNGGLITPIVRQANLKPLPAIAAQTKALVSKARAGQLVPTDYEGGTMTISNLGMYGMQSFSAIINPPQACILSVGAGEKRPVVLDDGTVGVGTVLEATVSVDHRAIDGAVAAQFLGAFRKALESPALLLI
jgi:pyruvate dehydrogenase E2 component (dihydrolipoamide acetyltransferase)